VRSDFDETRREGAYVAITLVRKSQSVVVALSLLLKAKPPAERRWIVGHK